jgi:hypothetical protein
MVINIWGIIIIGYYTVLCTIWRYIVRVCIVLKTRIPIRVFNTIRTSTIYFHIVHNTVYCTSVFEHHYKIFYNKIAIFLLFQLFDYWAVHRFYLRLWTGNVNRFRGFLVPRPNWIKVLYLFGTLGLHRLLTKTLKFLNKIQNFTKISKY